VSEFNEQFYGEKNLMYILSISFLPGLQKKKQKTKEEEEEEVT
jgi:hypothetical protein